MCMEELMMILDAAKAKEGEGRRLECADNKLIGYRSAVSKKTRKKKKV